MFCDRSMSFEVIDALFNPGCYDTVYPYSYLFTWFVTIPHSLLAQLAFPADNAKYSESLSPGKSLLAVAVRCMCGPKQAICPGSLVKDVQAPDAGRNTKE